MITKEDIDKTNGPGGLDKWLNDTLTELFTLPVICPKCHRNIALANKHNCPGDKYSE